MNDSISSFEIVLDSLNKILWGPITITLFFGLGIYFTVKLNFFQITKIKYITRNTVLSVLKPSGKNDISPYEAMTTALAGTVGTGNIVAPATAIAIGGPGALFWIFVSSFFGMMTKYAEIFLAIKFRTLSKNGERKGGPMYYIEKGLGMRWLALVFSIFAFFATFGIGNIAQINSVSTSLQNSLNIKPIVTGIIVASVTAYIIVGDAKRIAKTTSKVVPIMSLIYLTMCITVILHNRNNFANSIYMIIKYAFEPAPMTGGFVGSTILLTIRKGISNGIFSNEAGLGSAPIAHAMSNASSPSKQAVWGIFEVFVDTSVVCILTGLAIISSGAWSSGLTGAQLTIKSFTMAIGPIAPIAISITLFFLAFSSMISWCYYGEKCLEYILKTSKFNYIYKFLFISIIIIGSVTDLHIVWKICDVLNGFMAIPNMIALIFLSKIVIESTKKLNIYN